MPKREFREVYRTKAEADEARAKAGQPGYSERYVDAVREVPLTDGTTGWLVEGVTYSG